MGKAVARRLQLLTDANGQVRWELTRSLRGLGHVTLAARSWPAAHPDHMALDLTDSEQVCAALRLVHPALIVNSAAYTAVNNAEKEPLAAQ